MIGFRLGLALFNSVKQPVQPHSFSLLSCKVVKDASLLFITASYLQNKKHVCHPISKANQRAGVESISNSVVLTMLSSGSVRIRHVLVAALLCRSTVHNVSMCVCW